MRRNIDDCAKWSNFETWSVRKWLLNEPEINDSWGEFAEGLLKDGRLSKVRHQMCKALAAEFLREAEAFDWLCSRDLVSELIEAAISRVNWLELADELLLDLSERQNDMEAYGTRS
jgi:hypothetical protein